MRATRQQEVTPPWHAGSARSIRLPGLFRWGEVSDAWDARHDPGGTFVVRLHSIAADGEGLYTVDVLEEGTAAACAAS